MRSMEKVLTRQAAIIPTVGPATTTRCTIQINLLGSGNGHCLITGTNHFNQDCGYVPEICLNYQLSFKNKCLYVVLNRKFEC